MTRPDLRLKNVATAALVTIAAACADEKIVSRGYPVLNTYAVTDINVQGATFHGEILDLGEGISDHGFFYSRTTVGDYNSAYTDRISLGPSETEEEFSALANRNLINGRSYYVRAYAISKVKGTTVLGQEFTFLSEGSVAPKITGITPKEGTIGEKIIITGSGFSNAASNDLVRIGAQLAPVVKATPDSLWVIAPLGLPAGENVVHLEVGLQSTDAADRFTLLKLTVTSFEPNIVTFGDTVTVHGTNFPASPSAITVHFLDRDAQTISVSKTAVTVIVLNNVAGSSSTLKVTAGTQVVEATGQISLF